MFKVETKEAYDFDSLQSLQFGWDFSASQLGPSEYESTVRLFKTDHVGYNSFRYGSAYDQRLAVKNDIVSFGLLEPDNPVTWAHDQVIPNNALIVFPRDDVLRAVSPAGFCGNGMSFSEPFMESMAEQAYCRPLSLLLPSAGIYVPSPSKLNVVRAELRKWQQLVDQGAESRLAIISRREESLALVVLEALIDARTIEKDTGKKSSYATARALELIHSSELETISATELCKHAACSQRTLEKSFLARFGVTPKKYIKFLRMAEVHEGLRQFGSQDCQSIIELAGIHGFWHMGQFAADYRAIYGKLPSETLSGR
jgi:AraC family ethanolamine operon transcriptional activator